MKLKCNDGKVRTFVISHPHFWIGWEEAYCSECGETFNVHDTKILKPMFKSHLCKIGNQNEHKA